MKKVFTLTFLLVVIFSTTSFAQSNTEIIAKKWSLINITNTEMEEMLSQASEEEKVMFQEMVAEMVEDSFFDFQGDGSYTVKMGDDPEISGEWWLNDAENELSILNAQGEERSMIIEAISPQELILVIEENNEVSRTIMTLIPFE